MTYTISINLDWNCRGNKIDFLGALELMLIEEYKSLELTATTEFVTTKVKMDNVRYMEYYTTALKLHFFNDENVTIPLYADKLKNNKLKRCLSYWWDEIYHSPKPIPLASIPVKHRTFTKSVSYKCRSRQNKNGKEHVDLIVTNDNCTWKVNVDEVTSIKKCSNDLLRVYAKDSYYVTLPMPKNKEDARFRSCLEKVQKIVESNKGGLA